jgi:hypothetical protein
METAKEKDIIKFKDNNINCTGIIYNTYLPGNNKGQLNVAFFSEKGYTSHIPLSMIKEYKIVKEILYGNT